jgi:uncharacterized protein YegP (UPF0339 family)
MWHERAKSVTLPASVTTTKGWDVAAKFEIRSAKAGEFNWVLTSQGRTLATGESYTRKVSAEKAIASLRQAAATATVADLTLRPAKAPATKAAPAKKAVKKTTRAAKKSAG